jgi:hypothetical protein
MVGSLENLASVGQLMDLLRTAPRRSQPERAALAAAPG